MQAINQHGGQLIEVPFHRTEQIQAV